MPRDQQSSAINIWLETEYLERPLLARTLIQRCQPSVVSSSRAACSMRSRSALRRASRSSSVGGFGLKRRAIRGLPRLGARPAGGADPPPPPPPPRAAPPGGGGGPPRGGPAPPPPARPPGRATMGWRVGPPAGSCDYASPSSSSATAASSVFG